jgi:uncharacterized membrane protein (DUF106 family)
MTLLGLHPVIEEIMLALVIIFITTMLYKLLIKKDAVKKIKEEQKEKQQRIKELQKTNPEEANKLMSEVLKLSNKQFKLMMRPMMVSSIFIILVLSWMSGIYSEFIPALPFVWPSFLSWLVGVEGWIKPWLAWYILVSIPMNTVFRRLLGVEL